MTDNHDQKSLVLKYLKKFETSIVKALIGMMVFVILLSTVRLGWTIYTEMLKAPIMLLNSEQLFKVFGFILMILLGLEILGSIKAYISHDEIHVEVVFTIALISIAKIIITTDLTGMEGTKLAGIGFVILSLSIGYYLIKKIHKAFKA